VSFPKALIGLGVLLLVARWFGFWGNPLVVDGGLMLSLILIGVGAVWYYRNVDLES
jgi:hypothetical protein